MREEKDDPPIDYNKFYEKVWPILVKRIPSFQNAKVTFIFKFLLKCTLIYQVINAWHSYEDFNTFDDVPIFGEHFHHENFYQVLLLNCYNNTLIHDLISLICRCVDFPDMGLSFLWQSENCTPKK